MVSLNVNTVSEFIDITGYDLNAYLSAFNIFKTTYYPSITDFYSGKTSVVPIKELSILDNLELEAGKISSLFSTYKQALNQLQFWFLIDFLDDLKIQIFSMQNIGRFYRSSISISGYGTANEFPYTLGDQQTLENVESDVLSSNDPNQDWVQLALRNDLKEVQYNINAAGNNLTIFKPIDVVKYNLQSVVDYLTGLAFYGKDISKNIAIVVDTEDNTAIDLDTVNFQDAFTQAIEILIGVTKGSIPEFPVLGIEGWIGSNLNIFNFKSFIRQITEVFQTDDTVLGFSIDNLEYEETSIFVNFSVNSFYNLVYKTNTKIAA